MGEYLEDSDEYVGGFVTFMGLIDGSRNVQSPKLPEIADTFKKALCRLSVSPLRRGPQARAYAI